MRRLPPRAHLRSNARAHSIVGATDAPKQERLFVSAEMLALLPIVGLVYASLYLDGYWGYYGINPFEYLSATSMLMALPQFWRAFALLAGLLVLIYFAYSDPDSPYPRELDALPQSALSLFSSRKWSLLAVLCGLSAVLLLHYDVIVESSIVFVLLFAPLILLMAASVIDWWNAAGRLSAHSAVLARSVLVALALVLVMFSNVLLTSVSARLGAIFLSGMLSMGAVMGFLFLGTSLVSWLTAKSEKFKARMDAVSPALYISVLTVLVMGGFVHMSARGDAINRVDPAYGSEHMVSLVLRASGQEGAASSGELLSGYSLGVIGSLHCVLSESEKVICVPVERVLKLMKPNGGYVFNVIRGVRLSLVPQHPSANSLDARKVLIGPPD